MSDVFRDPHSLHLTTIWRGFRRLLPIALFVSAFGFAFGLAAVQKGLPAWQVIMMSFTIFAGTAQFASLDLWGQQLPLVPIVAVTLAINARLLLMGASLYPWLRDVPAKPRYTSMIFLTDAVWAIAASDYQQRRHDLGLLLGGGLVLWLMFLLGTIAGTGLGGTIRDPALYGLDMVMGCFMLSLIVASRVRWRHLLIWSVAAAGAGLAWWLLPGTAYVFVGAFSGGLVGMLMPERSAAA
jgi:predicted branched-subunit amino acid permease